MWAIAGLFMARASRHLFGKTPRQSSRLPGVILTPTYKLVVLVARMRRALYPSSRYTRGWLCRDEYRRQCDYGGRCRGATASAPPVNGVGWSAAAVVRWCASAGRRGLGRSAADSPASISTPASMAAGIIRYGGWRRAAAQVDHVGAPVVWVWAMWPTCCARQPPTKKSPQKEKERWRRQ